jgi:uncharacterized RDD family membrane protein YckC
MATASRDIAELELPDEIDLRLQVANAGSRTLAILIDLSICGLALALVYGLTDLVAQNTEPGWLVQLGTNALRIALILVVFGVQWGYFTLFEWRWNGQTPGKRLLSLRVVKTDGTPVGAIDVLLRNLSRPLDTFGPMGLIGLLMIFVGRHAQRLGDLMARTLVIHETAIDWSIFGEEEPVRAGAPAPIRLGSVEWELLHRYLNRREHLEPAARRRLAELIHRKLKPRTRGTDLALSNLPPDDWLTELGRRA